MRTGTPYLTAMTAIGLALLAQQAAADQTAQPAPPTQTAEATTQTAQAATQTAQAGPQTAQAGAPAAPAGLEEVVVTAEKRSENIQDAPAAITAVSGDMLVTQGFQDIRDATVLFPSVKFGAVETSTHLYIRGIGAEQDRASIDPLSTMTMDNVNLPREVTGNNLFDVSSVEMLPGPQSTLYGNSSAGGTVNVVNNRPTDQFETKGTLEFGNYAFVHATAIENLPVDDKLDVRVAVDYARHDGYFVEGSDSEDEFGGRLSFLYKPTDDFTAYVWGSYNHTGGEAANTTTLTAPRNFENPSNPWDDSSCAPSGAGFPLGANPSCDPFYIGAPIQDMQTIIIGGQFDWRLDLATLTMIPSYLFDNQHELQYFGPFSNLQNIWNHQWSDELRATSNGDGPLKWLGGLYWYKDFQYQFFNINNSAGNPDIWNREDTYAAYGQGTYSVLDWLRVTGGLRYSSNHKEGWGCNCAAGGGKGVYFDFDHTWNNVDWKVGLDADVAENSLVYATVQTGYDNGAYQYYNTSGLLGPQNVGPAPEVEPSKLLAYTIGTKNRFLDNHLQVNNEAYWYDYKDLLIAPFDDNPAHFGNAFYNASKVVIYGDELSVKYLFTDDDEVQANLGYLHARAKNFVVGFPPENYDNFELIEAPDVTLTLGYQHTWELDSGASIVFFGDTHFENGFWGTFNHAPTTRQPAYTMTDLTLTYYSASQNWNVALWAKNVENSAVIGPGAYVGAGAVGGVYWLLPPQTFGVRLSASFGGPKPASPPAVTPPAPPPAPPAPPPAPPVEAKRSFEVFFDFDKSNITEAAAKVIQSAADAVKAGNVVQITVTGHTDTVGTASYNQGLSERRAAAVKQQLVADGVAAGEITAVGVGKTGLLVPTADGVREPQNRRAEIVLQ